MLQLNLILILSKENLDIIKSPNLFLVLKKKIKMEEGRGRSEDGGKGRKDTNLSDVKYVPRSWSVLGRIGKRRVLD